MIDNLWIMWCRCSSRYLFIFFFCCCLLLYLPCAHRMRCTGNTPEFETETTNYRVEYIERIEEWENDTNNNNNKKETLNTKRWRNLINSCFQLEMNEPVLEWTGRRASVLVHHRNIWNYLNFFKEIYVIFFLLLILCSISHSLLIFSNSTYQCVAFLFAYS